MNYRTIEKYNKITPENYGSFSLAASVRPSGCYRNDSLSSAVVKSFKDDCRCKDVQNTPENIMGVS